MDGKRERSAASDKPRKVTIFLPGRVLISLFYSFETINKFHRANAMAIRHLYISNNTPVVCPISLGTTVV